MITEVPPLMAHQGRGISCVNASRLSRPGVPIVGVAPPGAGKSRVMEEQTISEVQRGGRVVIMVNRILLFEQLAKGLEDRGIEFGCIADGFEANRSAPVQLVSAATLWNRAIRSSKLKLPEATLVLIDECHTQAATMTKGLLYGVEINGIATKGFIERGADVVGYTATPVFSTGSDLYRELVDFGSYSELRKCGMHQRVRTVGPEEIDVSDLKPSAAGEYDEKLLDMRARTIFGNVFDSWNDLNMYAYPAILFGPSAACARWFAEEYMRRGVKAAYIGADGIMMPEGRALVHYKATPELRESLLEGSRTGEIPVICNRFVLREAINMPWVYHAIFATVMGTLSTALQSVGRLQRYWAEYDHKLLQDHGGFWWRHGDPNEDRAWKVGLKPSQTARLRLNRLNRKEASEGIRCGKCGEWRPNGGICLNADCRFESNKSVRAVRMKSGKLKEMPGPVLTAKSNQQDPNKLWISTLYRCAMSYKTVGQAVQIYRQECEERGMVFDVDALRHRPPKPWEAEFHWRVKEVYSWIRPKR